jgi:predicted enzyme related to lactoylglutathione lyase
MKIGYTNIFVSSIEKSIPFFRDILGLTLNQSDPGHGYASFNAGPISFGVAQTDDASLVGRHTGIGFMVEDIDSAYGQLKEKGVQFEMAPTKQPWGGTLALFTDPDHNVFYLDPGGPH